MKETLLKLFWQKGSMCKDPEVSGVRWEGAEQRSKGECGWRSRQRVQDVQRTELDPLWGKQQDSLSGDGWWVRLSYSVLTPACSLCICLCVSYGESCPWLPSSWGVCWCLSTWGKGMKIWYLSPSVTHTGNPLYHPVPRALLGSSILEPFNKYPRHISGNFARNGLVSLQTQSLTFCCPSRTRSKLCSFNPRWSTT